MSDVRVLLVDANSETLTELKERLADAGYRVFLVDLRGHGRSPDGARPGRNRRGQVEHVGARWLHGLRAGAEPVRRQVQVGQMEARFNLEEGGPALPGGGAPSPAQADLTPGIDHPLPGYVAPTGEAVERPAHGSGCAWFAQQPGDLTFPILHRLCGPGLVVTDEEVLRAMASFEDTLKEHSVVGG